MNVYFISGLCADRSIFKYIQLPEGQRKKFLDWIPPHKGESLTAYALRMSEDIDFQTPFSLVGLSLGGMIASELSRLFSPVQTVLISSIPSPQYLPSYYKAAARTGIYRIVPPQLYKQASFIKR